MRSAADPVRIKIDTANAIILDEGRGAEMADTNACPLGIEHDPGARRSSIFKGVGNAVAIVISRMAGCIIASLGPGARDVPVMEAPSSPCGHGQRMRKKDWGPSPVCLAMVQAGNKKWWSRGGSNP